MRKPLRFIVVGSGFRSLYFGRIAKTYPTEFEMVYMLCRTEEKAKKIAGEHHIPTTSSIEACEEAKPDFVVIAVDRASMAAVTEEWIKKGYPVVTETPVGATKEELKKIWEWKQQGAKITVCEQYHRYPTVMAGLKAIEEGKIGDPYAVSLSLAHDYHGVSLIRRMLRNGIEPVTLRGSRYRFPVEETDSRKGRITDGRVAMMDRNHVTLEFASGKVAFYDFSSVQYRSYIRTRHLNVQGQKGEWSNTMLYYSGEDHRPRAEQLLPFIAPKHLVLDTKELRDLSRCWTPELLLEQQEDEFAIATMLYDLREYLEGGQEVYPLEEALEDAYLWLLMEEAEANPGKAVHSERMPWHKAE